MYHEPVRQAYSSLAEQYIDLFDGEWQANADDLAFIRRHLAGVPGPVLDLGCGPGYWSGYLYSLGVDVTGVDLVPEFIAHARTHHPGPTYRLGSMTESVGAQHAAAGILAWYSTIHLPPPDLVAMLTEFRRLLASSATLVVGFFDSDDHVAEFDHKVLTAYRWPADVLAQHLAQAGFAEVERLQQRIPARPDRIYGAIAARAT
ncbi:methyltransferase family protein [Jatrophihabitans sp. GAS493]|uniref:class I SAM-dependent methyltransferase n=1 Tax=Jatrophihabitans sp. GAS493 TaxID=1907575 RepID=UPI000BBFD08D|nr:class I SAM-dependent methyltransferase [Jatrophihabitans sp. GAS493]SOD73003.1 methyltransferase family protein [Jatrophihabitans sp. GAS493]